MLYKAKLLKGYRLAGLDGEIGKVQEFYFDDRHWVVRYLVAQTGTWLTNRQVLISPHSLAAVIEEEQQIEVELTKKQIEDSPPWESHKPVSRQFEESYYGYYGWPTYWYGPDVWGYYSYPMRDREQRKESIQSKKAWDHHLRSTDAVRGHYIQATDGEIGHVEDFVIDDETWAIRYLVVATQNWWPGKKVLLSPRWIELASWKESKVFVNLSRETIKQSPEYTEESLLTRDYETGLHRHYNRAGYWDDEAVATAKTKSNHRASKSIGRSSDAKH
jgi:sporulation protein YlmC with PRC-barrel domain